MKGTGITRSAPPEKPYLWRGSRRLIEVCKQLEAERKGRPAREVEPTFSFPQPLPGGLQGSGSRARPKPETSTGGMRSIA
jgi:hypothetical protein